MLKIIKFVKERFEVMGALKEIQPQIKEIQEKTDIKNIKINKRF